MSLDKLKYITPYTINGLNLYAYCNNDPVNFIDPNGNLSIKIIAILVLSTVISTGLVVTSSEHPLLESTTETKYFEVPSFLKIGKEGMAIVSFSTGLVKKNWWISKENGTSISISTPSIDFSFDIPFKDDPKIGDFLDLTINFGSFSYDGKYFDFGLNPGFKIGKESNFNIGSFDFDGESFLNDCTNLLKKWFG